MARKSSPIPVTATTATGVNTQATGNASANQLVLFGGGLGVGESIVNYFDDLYLCDGLGSVNNTFLGDIRVQALLPTSDGAATDWTPSAGSDHYALVNEVPSDGDASYVASATPGDIDEYGVTPIAVASGTVFGVQVGLYARKDDAGSRNIAPVVRESGTDHVGSDIALGASYAYYFQVYDEDPATSAAWTIAGINGDQFGVKVTA